MQTRSRAALASQRADRLVGVDDPTERFKVTMRNVRLYALIGAICRCGLGRSPLGCVLIADTDEMATAGWLELVDRCDDELCREIDHLAGLDHRIPELEDAAVVEYLASRG